MSALLPPQSLPNQRPHLYLVSAPVQRTPVSPSTYRRRRLAVLGIAALSVITGWVLVQSVTGAVLAGDESTGPMQTISATQPIASSGDVYWTVRPGDTLWSIAQAVHPKGDIRPVLKRLDDRYGSMALVAGQNILVS